MTLNLRRIRFLTALPLPRRMSLVAVATAAAMMMMVMMAWSTTIISVQAAASPVTRRSLLPLVGTYNTLPLYRDRRRRKTSAQLFFSDKVLLSPLTLYNSNLSIRGGASVVESESSTLTSENEEDETADASLSVPMNPAQKQQHQQLLHYHTQQHLYLTSRSLHLRQALIQHRGLTELALQQPSLTDSQQQPKVPIDWECAISTRTSPKSCLYALDAEVGAKVIAPALPLSSTDGEQEPEGSYQWITVSALNRLRRTDPSKVDPLWHNQYAILSTWFGNTNNNINNNNWSLYSHLPLVPGRVLSAILDQPIILTVSLIVSTLLSALIFWPILEGLVKWLLTSRLLWMYYSSWSRFVHAALPLKLLVAQMLYKAVWDALATVQAHVQSYLVDWECQLLQDHLPVTLLENEPDLKNSESYDVPGDDDDNNDGDDDEY